MLTFSLNTDSIGYYFLARGVGGFIEPISGSFNPFIMGRKKEVDLEEDTTKKRVIEGKYAHPLKLIECDYNYMKELNKSNGKPFPCDCFECSRYSSLPKGNDYNRARRKHRAYIRDRFITEFNEAVVGNKLRVSMFDRMAESPKLGLFKNFYS